MVAYSILLNLILLIGVGCIVGILVVVILVNVKLGSLIRNMSELNKNLSNIKWNSNTNNLHDPNTEYNPINQAKVEKSAVNAMTYKSDSDTHVASFKEEQLIQEKIKSLQEIKSMNEVQMQNTNEKSSQADVGIVFCRNCASHFTSDKDACPICGAKR